MRSETIALDKLYEHPDNAYSMNESELADLMQSIKHEGLAQLPLVRPYQDGYQIIAGHRRVECFRRLAAEDPARFGAVPCTVREDLDDEMALILLDTTNLMTRQLSPLERAKRFERIWNLVPALRKRDENLRGVRTSQVIADIVTKETGQSVSRATIDRALMAGRRAKEVNDLTEQYAGNLISGWYKEFKTREGFTPDLVKAIATRDGRVQEQLFADYQRNELTPKQLANMLEHKRSKTDVDAERMLDAMIRQARELNAMQAKDGVDIDSYRLKVLLNLLNKL